MTDPRTRLIASMTVFGTLGIFVSLIPLPSALIVMVRAVVGTLFVGGVMLCKRQRPQADALKQNARLLLCSGVALGLNWTLLFEAYRYTTVAVATLCYYMAPVFLLLLSPIVLKEPMTRRKAACVACSLLGAALVSGAAGGGSVRGVALGLAAAALYCAIMLMNKKMQGLAPMETTFAQLCISALVITPYALLTSGLNMAQLGAALVQNAPMLLVVGLVHTGVAYALYFPSINVLPGQTVAMLSYIDPVLAVVLSALVLRQTITPPQILGALLLLGGTFVSEWKQGDT